MLCVKINKEIATKPLVDDYYLLQVKDNPEYSQNDSMNSSLNADGFSEICQKIVCCYKLSVASIMKQKTDEDLKKKLFFDQAKKEETKDNECEDEQQNLKKRKVG